MFVLAQLRCEKIAPLPNCRLRTSHAGHFVEGGSPVISIWGYAMALTTFGIFFLIGATFSVRFNVLILFPAIGLALFGTAAVGIAHGDRIGSIALIMVLIGTALQLGYLAGIDMRVLLASISVPNADVPRNFAFLGGHTVLVCSKASTFKTTWRWWVQMASMSARSITRKPPTASF
jgi:hypothetical protein